MAASERKQHRPRVPRASRPRDVDAVYADLTGAGYESHKEPWDAFWGQRYAQVRDPDGHVIDLFAPL